MAFTKEQLEKLGITYKEGMTDEEIFNAISAKHDEHVKLKTSFDKTSSELASLKKEKQENLSEDEKTKAKIAELEEKLATREKEATIRDIKDQYVGLGYSPELADKIAKASIEGKYADVAKYQKEHLDAHDAKLKEDLMKGNPKPNAGDPNKGGEKFTKENFRANKISYAELQKLHDENPTLYEEITK